MSTTMEAGTASYRFVAFAVLAAIGWSWCVMCTDGMAYGGMAHGDMALDGMVADVTLESLQNALSDMEEGVAAGVECLLGDSDCCTMTKPFLSLSKMVAPQPELAAISVPGSCLPTRELSSFHDLRNPNGESPPGITGTTYLTISVLRI